MIISCGDKDRGQNKDINTPKTLRGGNSEQFQHQSTVKALLTQALQDETLESELSPEDGHSGKGRPTAMSRIAGNWGVGVGVHVYMVKNEK